MNKQKLIAVVGATASGKTSLSIEIAKSVGGEVVSCDSMQIYRGMTVATAAPTPEDIASEISENMEKLVGAPLSQPQSKPVRPLHPESSTIKFDDLQFGKNYDPTR